LSAAMRSFTVRSCTRFSSRRPPASSPRSASGFRSIRIAIRSAEGRNAWSSGCGGASRVQPQPHNRNPADEIETSSSEFQ
jgi:hypothetical protein